MGILDSELRPYLERVTKDFEANGEKWLSHYQTTLSQYSNYLENAEQHKLERKSAAEKFREQGNVLLKAQDFAHALFMYSESISAAIEGPLASLAYFNRSAALFHLKFYEDCIKDIDRALESGYPKPQQLYMLHLRKAQCLKFLNKDCDGCVADTMKAIEENNTVDKIKSTLKELVLCKMEEPEPVCEGKLLKPNTSLLPELSYGSNPEVPSFSSAILLDHSKELGRHVVANRNINTGDVLIVEDSIVSSVFMDARVHRDFCTSCFKHCLSLIPCKICGFAMYCDEYCRDKDWITAHQGNCNQKLYHDLATLEPPKLYKTKSSGQLPQYLASVSLVSHLISFVGFDNIKKIALENKPMTSLSGDPKTKGFQDGKFHKATIEALLSLDDNFENQSRESLKNFSNEAFTISYEDNIPSSEWLPVAAIIMKLSMVANCNRKTINCCRVNYQADFIWQNLSLGFGLFLASSLVNHSCDPNMYQVFYGTSTVFRARRPISKGEQLTCCYLEPVLLASHFDRKQRQKLITEFHRFKCRCSACAGSCPLLHCLAVTPATHQMRKWLENTGQVTPKVSAMLAHFCISKLPATKKMLPKLLSLLQKCHDSGQKSNRWYVYLQEIIQSHYKAQGSCLFYDNSKEILYGEEDFFRKEMSESIDKLKVLTL